MAELSKLGRYQLRRVLGRGAMGVVYDGFDPTINRRVAVKTILKSHAIDEEVARDYSARFVREAQAAGRINHPNIVQVYDFGEQDDIAYLVMEFIQGRELRSFFVAKERFEIKESVRIMGELLDALDFAHDLGVVHRDVKPANVMLDSQLRVKLADFGVARVQDGAEQSQAGTMVGTPAFMSPEQISGGKIDRRTDVFSAGTILYQLLTGEQPFTGDGAWTVAKKIMQDDPARPSSIVTNLPLAFDEVVKRALAKAPAQRFASAREFAVALRSVLGGVQSAASATDIVIPKQKAAPATSTSEAEVEFWRSIQNSNDAEEFTVYLDAFPEGTYAQLARLKIAKLKAGSAQDTQTGLRLAAEDKARQEAEERAKREAAEEQQRQEAEAKARHEAEERARREAEDLAKAQAEALAKRRAAEEKARREAEEHAKRKVAEEKARQETEARARREADERAKQEALEKARQEAAAKAKREAEMQARVDAEVKARREAADKARRESEEKVRQAQALARLRQQEEAAARAKATVDEDSTVAFDSGRPKVAAPETPKSSFALPAAAAAVLLIAAGVGAYLYLGKSKAPEPVAQPSTPSVPAAPAKVEVPAAEIEKIRKETEERIRREYADKSAAEQASAAKAAADRAVAEKQVAMKAAAEKATREKAAADKLAREKAVAEKAVAEKAAAEKAGAAKSAAERSAADRAAAEKVAADKAAAEKAAAEKAAAAKAAAASAAPSASANSADALLQQAIALEGEKRYVDAVRTYMQAARAGSGPAAKRLGDIYVSGVPGVAPDSAESTKWHTLARARGAMK